MAPGLVDTTMPYANGARHEIGRPQDTWGTPLPTRKLSPQDDIAFDPSLKPRAHKMDSMEIPPQITDCMPIITTANSTDSKVLFLNVQM